MISKKLFAVLALATIAIFGISLASAFGLGQGFMHKTLSEVEKEDMRANIDAIRQAIQDKDYDAWKSLMEQQIAQLQSSLTEENFNELVDQHANMLQQRESGNFSEMRGPKIGNGYGKGMQLHR